MRGAKSSMIIVNARLRGLLGVCVERRDYRLISSEARMKFA
jgi:hypothetical protein